MSTMENAGLEQDISSKKESTISEKTNSVSNRQPCDYTNFNYKTEKNNTDLQSNNKFLKKKRDSDLKMVDTPNEESNPKKSNIKGGIKENFNFCTICNISGNESSAKLKKCKNCNKEFHLDCLLSIGEYELGENFICINCRKQLNLKLNLTNYNMFNQDYLDKLNFTQSNNMNTQNMNNLRNSIHTQNTTPNMNFFNNTFSRAVPNPNINAQQLIIQQLLKNDLTTSNQSNSLNLLQNYLQILKSNSNNARSTQTNASNSINSSILNPSSETNKLNHYTNFNIINNLINCSNYNNIINNNIPGINCIPTNMNNTTSNQSNKNILINQMCQQMNLSNIGFPKFIGGINGVSDNSNAFNNYAINNAKSLIFSEFLQNRMNNNSNKNTQYNEVKEEIKIKKQLTVEDKILFNNPQTYHIDTLSFNRPEIKKINVPENLVTQIIVIWDFIISFQNTLFPADFVFNHDLENFYEKLYCNDDLFKKLVISFINIIINTIMLFEPNEFTDDKELLIFRIFKDSTITEPIFTQFECLMDLLALIFKSKKFSLFVDDNIKLITSNIKAMKNTLQIDEKISILYYLVNSLLDTPKVKFIIKSEVDRKNELVKEQLLSENEYKNKELRKRELFKNENFLKAPMMIEVLSKNLINLENNKINLTNTNYNKQKKELENEREKYRNILKEFEDTQAIKDNIILRLKSIKVQLQDMKIHSQRLIGTDLFKNEYYFFNNILDKIYVKKYENYQDLKNKKFIWGNYDNHSDIQNFISKLLENGMKEKKLKRNLSKILSKKMNFEKPKFDDNKNSVMEKKHFEHSKSLLELAYDLLIKLEEKFSEYLVQYNKQWETIDVRNKWKETIKNYCTLKNCVTSLMMFNLRFKNAYRSDEDPSDNEENENLQDSPKFIFTDDKNNEILSILEFDKQNYIAPKVKIWSREFELNEMDKYFSETMLPNILSHSQLFLAVYFFEFTIFLLIKRKEPLKKNHNLINQICGKDDLKFNILEVKDKSDCEEIKEKPEISMINSSHFNQELNIIEEINDKTLSIEPDINDCDITESIKLSVTNSQKISNINKNKSDLTFTRKKRNAVVKNLQKKTYKETCYICYESGDLISCESCMNLSHIFCACLEKIPAIWYCDNCKDRRK